MHRSAASPIRRFAPPRFVPILLLLAPLTAPAQAEDAAAEKPPKIFTDDAVISARAEAPWRNVMRHKESDRVWEGVFRYTDRDGAAVSIPIEIAPRGLTRKRVCDFPPLRFRFDKEAARGTAFRGAGSLKLVTHCLFNSKYEQYYVKEYLAYRVYNLITDLSYRVQGLDMDYADDAEDDNPIERFAFLIEDPDDVARRNGLEKLDINDIEPDRLDPLETSRFMLFQYLIGNLDWSALGGPGDHCCHNARLIGPAPDAPILNVLPYDLDSSGLVNAHYASPPEGLPVRNVRQRLYRGFCAHNDAVAPALEEYRNKRADIEALFKNEDRLDRGHRKRALAYIEDFYETLDSPEAVQEELIDNCRG